jgi:hypothetical protein
MAETEYFDDENPPNTASAGEIAAEAAAANENDVSNPSESAAETGEGADTQDTNAEPSVTPIPDRFPVTPKIPAANNPFQDFARNAIGGVLGTGGSFISAASVTQSRVERNTQSFVYRTTQVTSRFSQGRFTQILEGVILNFDDFVSNSSVNTNQASNLDPRDADAQPGGFYGSTTDPQDADAQPGGFYGTGTREYQSGAQNPSTGNDAETSDDQGGTGPAQSSPATSSDGQDIDVGADTSGDEGGSTSEASQVIARDD